MGSILQWNIDGYYSHIEELRNLICQFQPLAVALQETKLKPKNNPSFKNYTIFKKDHTLGLVACGGVALLVKSCHSPREISINSIFQCIAIDLIVDNLRLTIMFLTKS